MKKLYLFVLITLLTGSALIATAQSIPRYLVYFKDKANSPFSTQNPEAFLSQRSIARRLRQGIPITTADLPVNPSYVQAIRQTGAKVLYSTRWFNGSLVEATDAQLKAIQALGFYKGLERGLPIASSVTPGIARLGAIDQKFGSEESVDYGAMKDQLTLLGVPTLHEKGILGQGMLIAILDAGFSRANELDYLKHLYTNKKILDTYDFVTRENNVYDNHFHGLNCLSEIAAYKPGQIVGAAYQASFALYRTENEFSETPYEEATWILGAERADSLGADIISSSLGYNQFTDPRYDYFYKDIDGKTALVTRAAQHASRRGMLVVASAGNEGNNAWKYITPPADADSILAVGATYLNKSKAPFSSIGPTADGRIKPDVAAVGAGAVIGNNIGSGGVSTGNGTSFSAPQIAGLAALLWQAYPTLNVQQLIDIIRKSGHQAANPDQQLGYGIPSAQKAVEVAFANYLPLSTEPSVLSGLTIYPNPAREELLLQLNGVPGTQLLNVEIVSVTGLSLWEKTIYSDRSLIVPIQFLNNGLYFLKVRNDHGVRFLRFVKY
jgi:serine protease AprX